MPSVLLKYNPEVVQRDLMAVTRALPALIEQTFSAWVPRVTDPTSK
jgi:hypothetical protein